MEGQYSNYLRGECIRVKDEDGLDKGSEKRLDCGDVSRCLIIWVSFSMEMSTILWAYGMGTPFLIIISTDLVCIPHPNSLPRDRNHR